MKWLGQWIWLGGELDSTINLRSLARKVFHIENMNTIESAILRITADTQYRLFVNGKWANDGPTRSFPWKQAYDQLEISKYLKNGKNTLAIVVQHHGEGTFQSLVTRPGLLVQLDISEGKRQTVIASDSSWRMVVDPGHVRWTGRISCQMPCEEQYDARCEMVGWTSPEFNDSAWPKAKVVTSVAGGPWKKLHPREIPLFDYERIMPERIVSVKTVKAPSFIRIMNVKRALWPERVDANHRYYKGALLTNIESSADQEVRLYPHNCGLWGDQCFLNGKLVKYVPSRSNSVDPKDTFARVRLKKGSNPLLVIMDMTCHFDDFQLILDAQKKVFIKSPVCKGEWAVAGPFEANSDDWEKLKKTQTLNTLRKDNLLRYFHEPPFISQLGDDVSALATYQHTLPGQAKTQQLENLLAANNELAVIDAQANDVEMILDLGQEYNAHVEFDLDAPAGVEIDAHCFENMVGDVPQYTGGNRSGFRYTTREGWQKFTTFRHFGMRYLMLTFRNLSSPVRIRRIRTLFVHHQVEHRGQFRCNDYLLNKIWDVGKQTLLCCMEDTFTDCPTYEQTGWVGDARNEGLTCHTTFGQYAMTRRFAALTADSIERSDLTESQVPSAWENIIPVWSFLWVRMAWEQYQYAADHAVIKELYPAVRKMLSKIRNKYLDEKTGLFTICGNNVWNFFDWTSIEVSPCVTFNNMFLVDSIRLAEQMAKVIGKNKEAADWKKWNDDLIGRINKHLWSEKLGGYVDCIRSDGEMSQSISRPTNTLALLYDIAPANREKKILPIVLGEKTKNIVPFGSPFALFFLLEYLAKSGRFDSLAKIVRKEWGDMIDKGATTFWEQLGSTRSHCHAWSAAPTYFLSQYVLGVHPTAPGFISTLFQPYLLDLNFAKGIMPTPNGDIKIDWKKTGAEFTFNIDKPETIKANFRLPAGLKVKSVTVNGKKITGRLDQEIKLPNKQKVSIVAQLRS
jgi:hypothetical protein